jgi:magnesium-transporting ATPase (P-type)
VGAPVTTRADPTSGPPAVGRGLTAAAAATALRSWGPNEIPVGDRPKAWRHLLAQFTHFFALLLWTAAGLAVIAGMPTLAVAIAVVVVINGLFSFAQEHRAERAAAGLRDLLPRRCTVVRDGQRIRIDAVDVVPGDVVVLDAGDLVSADIEVTVADGARLDSSSFTGESDPVDVAVGDVLHAGTFLVEGEVAGTVVATGARTRLAGIAELTRAAVRPPTPLALELHRVVRTVAWVAIGVGAAFFALTLAVGTSATDAFLFAVGVTVALVPEGLLPTVTLSLARGAQRMAGRNALVRRLEAVETLGSTTFIWTDKTGTLTRNEMSVVAVWVPGAGVIDLGSPGYDPTVPLGPIGARARFGLELLGTSAAFTSTGAVVQDPASRRWHPRGDPMEAAIDAFARRVGAVPVDLAVPDVHHAFDPRRRRASAIVGGMVHVKGAPDAVLPLVPDELRRAEAEAAMEAMAARGLRLLAVARRTVDGASGTGPAEIERDLDVIGLLGFQDPPREGVREALAACRAAGISVGMITGDHPATARAVAEQLGLMVPGGLVIEGADLPEDAQVLGALLDRDGVVVCRVTPEDKLRIAMAVRARGHVVAMTGDGVNDGPALQHADIGVAMGRSGTDVAREAADLVLLDDDFSTIVAAVTEGRATFANIRRFLTYHLTDNVAELTPFVVWALSGGRFPLALAVLQVLFLDIGTDLLPALALGAEPPGAHVLDHPIAGDHLIDRALMVRVFGVLGPAEAAVEMAAFTTGLVVAGWWFGQAAPVGHAVAAASGAAFCAVVLGQLANAYACRSTRYPPWRIRRTNHLLHVAVAVELVALAVFVLVPAVADLLGHAPPPTAAFAVACMTAPAVLAADALHKRLQKGL